MDALTKIYNNHEGKVTDKWSSFLGHYDALFSSFRKEAVSILEVGVQNGGSLEIWSEYFPNARKIIGCDVDSRCNDLKYDDPRISFVFGNVCDGKVQKSIFDISSEFDLIIDDGSHASSDIIQTFLDLWPVLKDGGLYIIEDLHCSYWLEYEGGVNNPFSAINFFKNIIDIINFEHWGIDVERDYFLQKLYHRFPEKKLQALEGIQSIEFLNSMCVIKKNTKSNLGVRVVSGQVSEVDGNAVNFNGFTNIVPDQRNNIWSYYSDPLHPLYRNLADANKDMIASDMKYRAASTSADTFHKISNLSKHVALVIPYYNGSEFIDRCVDSVLAQSKKYDEIIIVDDGSEPEQSRYLDKFEETPGIKILRKQNGGQGSARNYGAVNSSSDFICFIDQDDFLLPIHNELLSAELSKSPDDGYVYGDVVEADGSGNIMRYGMIKDHSLHPKNHIMNFVGQDCFILPSASMITREAFLAVGGFDQQFTGYEDDDLFMRLWLKGYKGKFLDRPVYVWCIHTASTSYSIKMSRSRMKYVNKLYKLFPSQPSMARYWFRDVIFPRFFRTFLSDILKYKNDPSHAVEVFSNMDNLLDMAVREKVSKKTVLKIRAFLILARISPDFLFRSIIAFIRKYSIIKL